MVKKKKKLENLPETINGAEVSVTGLFLVEVHTYIQFQDQGVVSSQSGQVTGSQLASSPRK